MAYIHVDVLYITDQGQVKGRLARTRVVGSADWPRAS